MYPVAAVARRSTPSGPGSSTSGLCSFFFFCDEAGVAVSSQSVSSSSVLAVFGRRCMLDGALLISGLEQSSGMRASNGLCQRIEDMYICMYIYVNSIDRE